MNTALRAEFLTRLDLDQNSNVEDQLRVYKDNADFLAKVISIHGWPSIELVGNDGAEAAWIIAQHADHDLTLQELALSKLKATLNDPKTTKHHYPYLFDRVQINKGGQQVFGTQIEYIEGKAKPMPIKDPFIVDGLRKKYNLPPLKVYLEVMQKLKNDALLASQ